MDRGRPDASNSTIKNSTRHQMIAVSQLSCWKLRRKNIRCNACAKSIYPHPGNRPCLEHWRKNCKTCIPYRQMISDPLRAFGYFTRWSMVNGQPCMPHLGSLFQAQGKCETISVILQGVRLYAFTSHRKYLGVGIAWSTTWFSSRKINWRAFVNNEHPFGQGDCGWKDNIRTIWIASLDL